MCVRLPISHFVPLCFTLAFYLSFLLSSKICCQEETCTGLHKYPVRKVQIAIWKAHKNRPRGRSQQTLVWQWLHCCSPYSGKYINNTRCQRLMFFFFFTCGVFLYTTLSLSLYSSLCSAICSSIYLSQKWSFFRLRLSCKTVQKWPTMLSLSFWLLFSAGLL